MHMRDHVVNETKIQERFELVDALIPEKRMGYNLFAHKGYFNFMKKDFPMAFQFWEEAYRQNKEMIEKALSVSFGKNVIIL